MTGFNEFLIGAEKFNKLMFLILILLIIIAPLISLAVIFIKNKIRNNKNESEEKGNMLIIDKDKQYGFNPDYISERSYRSFENIKVVKYIYE